MTRSSPPPGEVSRVRAGRALVVAPHFDDEVLGCGGLLLQLVAAGTDVRALFLSDGSGGVEEVGDRREYAGRRRREAAAVSERIGLASYSEVGLEDGRLADHVPEIAAAIGGALVDFRPDLVLVPSPCEITPDHRAAFLALHETLSSLRRGDPLHDGASEARFLLYELNHPLHPDLLVDVGEQLDDIESLMTLYASQEERHPYTAAALGLRRYRTLSLPGGVAAAEAYRSLHLEDFTTRSRTGLVEHLGGVTDPPSRTTGPTVSVIMRTRDRPGKLAEALASVARSTYRQVEVVVVNDGGREPELPGDFPFGIVEVGLDERRGPAAAAQAGLEAATGDHVAFLDDDDLFFPEHLETLVHLARETGCPVVYVDAAVGVYERDPEGRWECRERRLPYSRDFDVTRLLVDNYIPFHTLLVERELATAVGPFDESLPFFEDWDFLIRLSARTRFEHLGSVTCEYRHFRGDGTHVFGSDPASRSDVRAGRARIYAKHADRLGPETLAEAVTLLRAETSERTERCRSLLAELRRLREDPERRPPRGAEAGPGG